MAITISFTSTSNITGKAKMKAATVELRSSRTTEANKRADVNAWITANTSTATNWSVSWKNDKNTANDGTVSNSLYAVVSLTYPATSSDTV